MRLSVAALAIVLAPLAASQSINSVYNRDNHDQFKLKNVEVESTVIGPIVRTSTLLTFENPYKSLTEASLNFEMPDDAALGGFAYYYGNEYVRGQLMDKAKAWFIYTAITSRNRDPGIMDQVTPTTYHAQIYPLKVGHDLRVRLYSIGFLKPEENRLKLPQPQVTFSDLKPNWNVRFSDTKQVSEDGMIDIPLPTKPITAVSQRFKDGRTYVAGTIRVDPTKLKANYKHTSIKIEKAEYGDFRDPARVKDVTKILAAAVKPDGVHFVAHNGPLGGDPAPGVVKTLMVTYRQDGESRLAQATESEPLVIETPIPTPNPTFARLRDAKWVALDDQTIAFMGWVPKNRKIAVRHNGQRETVVPKAIHKGTETARLWAQQKLAQGRWTNKKQVLNFSLKYGVPSAYTALLAVPQEEMKLFRQKEREFQKQQQIEARRQREWEKKRQQNWNRSGGGDPEIRIEFPNAKSVDAILPDGRVIRLTPANGYWGGNFEIPVNAAEGKYDVRIVALNKDGSTTEKSISYDVDRTAPQGTAAIRTIDGKVMLEARSEAKLAEVAAFLANGTKLVLKEIEPGIYRVELPKYAGPIKIMLKDGASNKREIACSS